MSVSTLAGTTWVINSTPVISSFDSYGINFTSNSNSYDRLALDSISIYYLYFGGEDFPSRADEAYSGSSWGNTNYRTIEIIDGTDVTNATLIAWLEANAEQQLPDIDYLTTSSELTSVANAIRIKGGTSASLVYPAGFVTAISNIPGATPTQTKSVEYTSNDTYTITPDAGYALSRVSVTVNVSGGGNPTFTIDGVTYQFDSSTTYWYDWVYSNYAPSGSSIESTPQGAPYVHIGGTPSNYGISGQYPGDAIVANNSYTTTAIYQPTDLTGTTWYFDGSLHTPFDNDNYTISFTSNNASYTGLVLDGYSMRYSNPGTTNTAYGPQSGPPDWTNSAYRTIAFSGSQPSGSDADNPSLYAFISSNATQI